MSVLDPASTMVHQLLNMLRILVICLRATLNYLKVTSDNRDYKPFLIKTVDCGPDVNNFLGACQIKKKYELDAVIEVTNASGLSAFNRVERRMNPLVCPWPGSFSLTTPLAPTLTIRGRLLILIWRERTLLLQGRSWQTCLVT